VSSDATEVGLGAEEARWRRSEEFIAQSPGCRQGTILAPVSAWHYCLAAGLFGLGTFWIDDATSGSRRGIAVAALLARSVAMRSYDSRPTALAAPASARRARRRREPDPAAPCAGRSGHVSSDATEGWAAEGGSSGRGNSGSTERAHLWTRERAFRVRATPARRAEVARAIPVASASAPARSWRGRMLTGMLLQ
jgi:hypothetical protein